MFVLAVVFVVFLVVLTSLVPFLFAAGSSPFVLLSFLPFVLPLVVPLLIVGFVAFFLYSGASTDHTATDGQRRQHTAAGSSAHTGMHADPVDALEVLKGRYASGEIDELEFERRLEVLVDADTPEEVATRLARVTDDPAPEETPSPAAVERTLEEIRAELESVRER
ncbi:hypothetical protein GCM10025298_07090 [Natronobiforma cellulositropha]